MPPVILQLLTGVASDETKNQRTRAVGVLRETGDVPLSGWLILVGLRSIDDLGGGPGPTTKTAHRTRDGAEIRCKVFEMRGLHSQEAGALLRE